MNSVKDDEDERDDGVWQCGLQYHCRNAGVRPTVLLPNGRFYLMTHMKNQLGFDLWYIFLGTFCICIAESKRIADVKDPVSCLVGNSLPDLY